MRPFPSVLILPGLLWLFAFALYFVILYNKTAIKNRFSRYTSSKGVEIAYFLLDKMGGFVLMGLLPFCVYFFTGKKDFLLEISGFQPLSILAWSALPCTILIAVSWFRRHNPLNHAQYPQMRLSAWSTPLVLLDLSAWIVYLIGYEFLFRGILFHASLPLMGFWAAALLNSVLYALAHLPKGRVEVIASFPFGIFLCWVTLETGSFWVACLIHISLALSNTLFVLQAQKHSGAKQTS